MDFDETVNFCSNWYKVREIDIPKTAKEWSAGQSGVNIPPKCTYQSLRKRGISVGNLLEKLLPEYTNRVKNSEKSLEFLKNLGLTLEKVSGIEMVHFLCNNCNTYSTALKGTLRRWESKGHKFCSICRKASGKVKSIEYYQKFLNHSEFQVISVSEGRLEIRHSECNKTFTRGTGYIIGDQRSSKDLVACPHCSNSFVYGKAGPKYSSLIEKSCIELLYCICPLDFKREVPYKDLIDTDRFFRLDIWIPAAKLGIEITSPKNNLPKYQKRLQQKLKLAKDHGLNVLVVTSESDIEDIVRTLSKDKEF